ncbi:MAG: HEAT repeat domain-containing protein [Desulfotignum sp.]
MAIDEKTFIDELIFCLDQEDIIKAKALLQFASDAEASPALQQRAMAELARGPEKVVYPLLNFLTKLQISSPRVRESLYELILDKSYGNTDLVIQYIADKETATRLMFIKAAGDLMLVSTRPALEKVLTTDTDPRILAAAIQSIGNLKCRKSLSSIAAMAKHPDNHVKRAAILAISETGGKDGVDMLLGFLGRDAETNKLAVEALAEIQDLYALEKLTSLLDAGETIVRDTAIDQLIHLGKKATPLLARAAETAQTDYLVHLITTLGHIKDPAAISPMLAIINTQPEDANIRQAVYEAMERIPSPKTAICLAQGLQDPVETVRMSAARAMDGNFSRPLVAGLKNIVRTRSSDAQNAVAALIDAQSDNIFTFLVEEPAFLFLAENHITNTADPDTRAAFFKKLTSLGLGEQADAMAGKIKDPGPAKQDNPRIIVVDDSKMMLRLYQNKLSGMGLSCRGFHQPESAVSEIVKARPELVITDLNMPGMSGLELTREIRKKYGPEELPILLITTQSDFVEEEHGDITVDQGLLTRSGINRILHKPFTDDAFKAAVRRYCPVRI